MDQALVSNEGVWNPDLSVGNIIYEPQHQQDFVKKPQEIKSVGNATNQEATSNFVNKMPHVKMNHKGFSKAKLERSEAK